jgi:hypothetical protein
MEQRRVISDGLGTMYCKLICSTIGLWNFLPALMALILFGSFAPALGTIIQWDANREPNLAGYRVYIGSQSRRYNTFIDVGRATSKTIESLLPGHSYYLAVTAYDSNGVESDFSAEIPIMLPAMGTNSYLVPFRLTFPAAATAATITFIGEAGNPCFVQASADMQTWQTICVFTPPTNGTNQWADPEARMHPTRFYRVIGSRP